MQSDWTYAALCLVVPLLWGVASARLFDWWQARKDRPGGSGDDAAEDEEAEALDMYHI